MKPAMSALLARWEARERMKIANDDGRASSREAHDAVRRDTHQELASPDILAADWNLRARACAVPPPFSDVRTESLFLNEYRLAGLSSVAYACLFGMATYVAIGAVDIAYGAWSIAATVRRLIAVSLIGFIVVLIFAQPTRVLKAYNVLLGIWSATAIIGLVSVTRLLRTTDATALVYPVSLIALWILYGFVRLPLKIAVFVGIVGSYFSMFGSRLTNMNEPGIRTVIYLVLANALGILLARSIELRERQLFLQRRVAEAAQAELERRTKLAEHASAEKTRLIAAVGHDLRQPMLSAVLHADVLAQRLKAQDLEGVWRQADRVKESVKLLGATLEHLLTAARYDAGTEPVRVEPILLSGVFRRLSELFSAPAMAKGIELRIREPQPGLIVRTDEQALMRILMNLLSNAVKFTPCRGLKPAGVVVRAFLSDDTCQIFVADTGSGIAERDFDAIWEPFFQVNNEERNRNKGLGLGLYLVRQSLIRLAGHSIRVRSTQGRGTRFVVSMPGYLVDEWEPTVGLLSTERFETGRTVQHDAALAGTHVLLVEDDQDAREAIEAQFDEWGVTYSSGISVEHVMNIHANAPRVVDAIVADFRLPGPINGIGSIEALRRHLGYAPRAVLITAEVSRERLIKMMPSFTVFIQKPFDAGALRASLLLTPSDGPPTCEHLVR